MRNRKYSISAPIMFVVIFNNTLNFTEENEQRHSQINNNKNNNNNNMRQLEGLHGKTFCKMQAWTHVF
jgi:hypothetical protein